MSLSQQIMGDVDYTVEFGYAPTSKADSRTVELSKEKESSIEYFENSFAASRKYIQNPLQSLETSFFECNLIPGNNPKAARADIAQTFDEAVTSMPEESRSCSGKEFRSRKTLLENRQSEHYFTHIDYEVPFGTFGTLSLINVQVYPPTTSPTDKFRRTVALYLQYLNSIGKDTIHYDVIYATERLRDARFTSSLALLSEESAETRASVIDLMMTFAAEVQTSYSATPEDVSRSTIQLAVSLFDRAGMVHEIPKSTFGLQATAAFCLVTAMQFETPNSLALENRLKKQFQIDRLIRGAYGVPYRELQQKVLHKIDCVVSVPLSIDFANYFIYKFHPDQIKTKASSSFIQLVCYLLDCFMLTSEAAVTSATLAAAAAVQLAKRITHPEIATNSLWTPFIHEITGCGRNQFRSVLKKINEFLTTRTGCYPGLKRLHENGWAAVEWELPPSSQGRRKIEIDKKI